MQKNKQILLRIGLLAAHAGGILGILSRMAVKLKILDQDFSRSLVKSEIGGLIVQTQLLCKDLDLDYHEVEKRGWERYDELKEALEKSGQGDKLI